MHIFAWVPIYHNILSYKRIFFSLVSFETYLRTSFSMHFIVRIALQTIAQIYAVVKSVIVYFSCCVLFALI